MYWYGKPSSSECFEIYTNRMDTQMVAGANLLREVLMISDGLLEFLRDVFQFSELDDYVKSLAS